MLYRIDNSWPAYRWEHNEWSGVGVTSGHTNICIKIVFKFICNMKHTKICNILRKVVCHFQHIKIHMMFMPKTVQATITVQIVVVSKRTFKRGEPGLFRTPESHVWDSSEKHTIRTQKTVERCIQTYASLMSMIKRMNYTQFIYVAFVCKKCMHVFCAILGYCLGIPFIIRSCIWGYVIFCVFERHIWICGAWHK